MHRVNQVHELKKHVKYKQELSANSKNTVCLVTALQIHHLCRWRATFEDCKRPREGSPFSRKSFTQATQLPTFTSTSRLSLQGTRYRDIARTRPYFQQHLETVPEKLLKYAKGNKKTRLWIPGCFLTSQHTKTLQGSSKTHIQMGSVALPPEILVQANI